MITNHRWGATRYTRVSPDTSSIISSRLVQSERATICWLAYKRDTSHGQTRWRVKTAHNRTILRTFGAKVSPWHAPATLRRHESHGDSRETRREERRSPLARRSVREGPLSSTSSGGVRARVGWREILPHGEHFIGGNEARGGPRGRGPGRPIKSTNTRPTGDN